MSFVMDIPETIGKQIYHLRPMPEFYPYFISCLLAIGVIGIASSNRKVHAALGISWFAILVGYVSLSVIAHIAIKP